MDLEGVLVPEIWIKVAEATGVDELKATTRDIPDYDSLMAQRLRLLGEHNLDMDAIQSVIGDMRPMVGAKAFMDELRAKYQVVILSDTFYEFAQPLMRQLDWPTLFCHRLETDGNGAITGYRLRMADHKRQAVKSFKALNFRVTAVGDSYNDTNMLSEADAGIFFRAPKNVIDEFPQFPVVETYEDLLSAICVPENGSPGR